MDFLKYAERLRDRKELGWSPLFEEEWDQIESIAGIIEKKFGGTYYPKKRDVFRAFSLCHPQDIKVIILGQDPYHSTNGEGKPIAMGLSFSVREGSSIPPSLSNIFKNIHTTSGRMSQCATTGDLTPWAEQGVFLLNTCLTVKPGEPASHKKIWNGFIQKTLAFIFRVAGQEPIEEIESENEEDEEETRELTDKDDVPITLLWGNFAQGMKRYCHGHILMASHPSPFSVDKTHQPFKECQHFVEVNKLLKDRRVKRIVW